MGAEFWEELFPAFGTKEETLERLQRDVLLNGRYFRIFHSKEGAIEFLQQSLASIPFTGEMGERMRKGIEAKIDLLKNPGEKMPFKEKKDIILMLNGEEGTKSPLDFHGFSTEPEMGKFQYPGEDRLRQLFGTSYPSLEDVRKSAAKLRKMCGRVVGVCIPVFNDEKELVEYYFCAYSAD